MPVHRPLGHMPRHGLVVKRRLCEFPGPTALFSMVATLSIPFWPQVSMRLREQVISLVAHPTPRAR